MGTVLRVLGKEQLSEEPLFAFFMRTEIGECFHVHWRDMRILMSSGQYTEFCNCVERGRSEKMIVFGKQDFLLASSELPDDILFQREAKIEEVAGNCIHFHYRDIRLELTPENFVHLCNLFKKAGKDFCFPNESVLLPMTDIDPYDHCHFSDSERWADKEEYERHIRGALLFKERIREGYQIKPIVVTKKGNKYKRRDGFKRYLAYMYLGMIKIPAYIVDEKMALLCPQHGEYPFVQLGAEGIEV